MILYPRQLPSAANDADIADIAADRPSSNLEWWYGYAFLTGSSGRRYALVASFFRVGELPVVKGHYLIHSFVRLDEGSCEPRSYLDRTLVYQMVGFYLPAYFVLRPGDRRTWNQYIRLLRGELPPPHRAMPGGATVRSDPARLRYGDCSLSFAGADAGGGGGGGGAGGAGAPGFDLRIADETKAADLRFVPAKPLSAVDESGDLNGLKYYSFPRCRVSGWLRAASGETETLEGEGWFDRQWGQNYDLLRGRGWDWFGLQLEDGRELLVSRLRKADSAAQGLGTAKLIGRDGRIAASANAVLTPLSHWRSPASGARYPAEWRLWLPELGMDLRVMPLLREQEIPIAGPIQAIWEGACLVVGEGRSPDGALSPIRSKGFAELVGYASG
ncbi:hypothetical protein H7B90_13920 [Cohnella xylanilytica]|uniref:AttH domain-containing protein n=1 Tax=Cohnella xylanilytica TaxID=557555 RepID=A0A841TZG3_9BACL|nr:lipocalin family protein [Cohnella xylanilytica]MBB6692502.1 hypothetical protein [Cohnella xylanilytica]